MKNKYLLFFFFCLSFTSLEAQNTFLDRGIEMLKANKPEQAITFLEAALAQGPPTEKIYLYLGLANAALGKNPQALKNFQKGAALKGTEETTLLFNWGLIAQKMEDSEGALRAYSQVLALDGTNQGALLNRGNSLLTAKVYDGALADYQKLLSVNPDHPQRENLNQVISLLKAQVQSAEDQKILAEAQKLTEEARLKAEAEAQRQAAEDAKLAEEKAAEEKALAQAKAAEDEAARLAAEQARLDEEQKQRDALLARVRASLGTVTDETKTIKAGDKGVETLEEDVPLAD